jgi:hypothetical protein
MRRTQDGDHARIRYSISYAQTTGLYNPNTVCHSNNVDLLTRAAYLFITKDVSAPVPELITQRDREWWRSETYSFA